MRGKVKWFSPDKGYGFIHGDDGIDRFVHVQEIQGADLPSNGAVVEFEHDEGKRGPRALKVKIESPGTSSASNSRVTCTGCNREMVPRVITGPPDIRGKSWQPIPKRSVCPFCGKTFQEFEVEKTIGDHINQFVFYGIWSFIALIVIIAVLN